MKNLAFLHRHGYLVRRWVYGVAAAGLALTTVYGLVAPEVAPLWLALILAIVNTRPQAVPDESAQSPSDLDAT